MIKVFILNSVFVLIYGWTVDKANHCSCKNYSLFVDCVINFEYGCELKDFTCQNVNCTAQAPDRCSLFQNQCYLDKKNSNSKCQPFNSCSDLQGNDDRECYAQNIRCAKLGETGPNCVEFKCSYYSVDTCPLMCFVVGEKCTDFPDCSTLQLNRCNVQRVCYNDEMTCKWEECSNYKSDSDCMYVYTPERRIQPCYWNEKDQICANAEGPEDLSNFSCSLNTRGAYHWSSSKLDSGSCQSCFEMLLKVVLAIILIFV
ncbi:unnamed protein product (macronuclear) [Paramecium tetraurelia]|uniref:Chromosome undetermined scaffold_178, whole genome shotgun sequence n=1 Tax=Paramecium tetraurelia TaxID=5888 RepID=Q3SDA2_PARTE|nr:uncharacterized protein GSPATT00038144001 [Paramecium tetraurelia]CAI44461.1 Mini antigen [Paramecium tetraurelia]CAK69702.1 unnamed protein product [Paramecium tetraurelia]|eukprot:XP_001437099.1 hypothetical protein (macronuclear) [Paramecium tetraurelia strain d4-2]